VARRRPAQGRLKLRPRHPPARHHRGLPRHHDPDARLIPALGYGYGYGYSDCHVLREAYGSIAYGFIPFRYGDAMTNLKTKHGADERIVLDDLCFQVQAAHTIARELQ